MHINSHYAMGLIFGIIAHHFYNYNFFITIVIIGGAFLQDVDIILSARAKDKNHRMLFTHSIWPALIVLLVASTLNITWMIIAGFAVLSHSVLDMLDWGTNLFYTEKLFGLRLLLSEKENQRLPELLQKYKNNHLFFTHRYYNSMLFRSIEAVLICTVIVLIIITNFPYYWLGFLYVPFFAFHTLLRKDEEKREAEAQASNNQ